LRKGLDRCGSRSLTTSYAICVVERTAIMNNTDNLNETELTANPTNGATSADTAPESPTEDKISPAEAARYFMHAAIGLVIGIPAVFVFAVAGALSKFEASHMNSAFQFFMLQFTVFLWGVYSFVRLKGYSWRPTLLGLLYLPGLLVILLLPFKNREASQKIWILSITCIVWFLVSFGFTWLALDFFYPKIYTAGI
jgi:hypothetical protein